MTSVQFTLPRTALSPEAAEVLGLSFLVVVR
jgi:hypothetical protein